MKSLVPALGVADVATSVQFYSEVLGFEVTFTFPGDDGELVHASVKRGDSEFMFGRLRGDLHDQAPLGRGVSFYMTVGENEDIDAFFARVKETGAEIIQEPADQFWGNRDWAVADPDGYHLYVAKTVRQVSPAEMREAMLTGSPAD
jgi:PhnB protein